MMWKARAGDRRNALRFEVVGTLAGSITTAAAVPLRNIGRGGALIEAPWPLPQDSIHRVRLESESQSSACEARVRHVRHGGDAPRTYLIGLEFLHVDPTMLEEIDRFIASDGASSE
jgi:c-di-GMP-binding flagellar brake protein YcgR